MASSAPSGTGVDWTGGTVLRTRLVTGCLLAALACGPIALALSVLSSPEPSSTTSGTTEEVGPALMAGEYAAQLVETWLTATRGNTTELEALYTDLPRTLPDMPAHVRNVSVAEVQHAEAGGWTVLVGADVADPAAEGWAVSWARRYFEVPVQVARTEVGSGVVATGLPALVAAPARLSTPADTSASLAVSSELGESITGFLSAYLTGAGPIDRYTSPGTVITPVNPPAYTAIELSALTSPADLDDIDNPEEGQEAAINAGVALTRADGQDIASEYRLTLTARAGRWEVAQVTPTADRTNRLGSPLHEGEN